MKSVFILIVVTVGLCANILFIGDSKDKYLCDNKENSPLKIQSCSKINAVTDIKFCYFVDSQLGCKKLFKGDSFNIKDIDNETLAFSRLLSFNTVKKTTFGVKRFGNVKELSGSILPQGDILKPSRPMKVFFDDDVEKTLNIKYKNKTIFSQKSSKKIMNISKNIFSFDKKYSIEIVINKEVYKSTFNVVDKETQKEVFSEIKKVSKNLNDIKSKAMVESIIYDQYGLTFNRASILKEIL